MRALLLLACALALPGLASAQTNGGNAAHLPSYTNRSGPLTQNVHWSQRLSSWIPSFRTTSTRATSINDIPNPETNGRAYINGFGFRRMR